MYPCLVVRLRKKMEGGGAGHMDRDGLLPLIPRGADAARVALASADAHVPGEHDRASPVMANPPGAGA